MIERITAGARHALHALIIRAQFQPKASALLSEAVWRCI
jgi:hypothetical protein